MAWYRALRTERRVTIGDFVGDFDPGEVYDLPDDVGEVLVGDGTVEPSDTGPAEAPAPDVQAIADEAAAKVAELSGVEEHVNVTIEEVPPA